MSLLKSIGLFSVISTAVVGATFVSCSDDKKNNQQSPAPQITIPVNPNSTNNNNNTNNPNLGAVNPFLGIDGTWIFTGFECMQGALTPWAKLENDLVSVRGLETGAFQWDTGGNDDGHILRRHLWTIRGDIATRESTLAFISAQDSYLKGSIEIKDSTAWASTKKHYRLNRVADGRMMITHGEIEGPFFQGLPLAPVHKLIEAHLDRQIAKGGISAALLQPIENIQTFLQKTFNGVWVRSIMDFANEVTLATESLNYTFDQSTMSFSHATLNIRGFTGEPGVKLVDVSACGVGGHALRKYKRVNQNEADLTLHRKLP